jgi:hypothetical protein
MRPRRRLRRPRAGERSAPAADAGRGRRGRRTGLYPESAYKTYQLLAQQMPQVRRLTAEGIHLLQPPLRRVARRPLEAWPKAGPRLCSSDSRPPRLPAARGQYRRGPGEVTPTGHSMPVLCYLGSMLGEGASGLCPMVADLTAQRHYFRSYSARRELARRANDWRWSAGGRIGTFEWDIRPAP